MGQRKKYCVVPHSTTNPGDVQPVVYNNGTNLVLDDRAFLCYKVGDETFC